MFQKPIEQTLASCLSFDFRLFIWCHLNIARIHTQLWRRRWWLKSWWLCTQKSRRQHLLLGLVRVGLKKKVFLSFLCIYFIYESVIDVGDSLVLCNWLLLGNLQSIHNTRETCKRGVVVRQDWIKMATFSTDWTSTILACFFLPTERTRISMAK